MKKISLRMMFVTFFLVVVLALIPLVLADSVKPLRVEGHIFSAQTRRPLPGVRVELWTFYEDGNREGRFAITDEGGLYVFEYHPNSNVETNGNQVLGYAFAIICNTPSDQKIQIMPLYTSLEKGIVYHRNVFLEVSSDITMCVQPQI